MKEHQSFAGLWAEVEKDDAFWTEKNILDFTTKLFQLMEHRKISKSELAERLGTSQAYVTKIFRGDANFTLSSMTKFVRALDAKLEIQIVPKEEHVMQWFKVLKNSTQDMPTILKNRQFETATGNNTISDNELEAYAGC
ncbi:MAG: helix-turn-helix transcriptional regulator [Desulfobacterales bacterium]|nr:helix-turn-helix transcriptional regulator [Desulfobacterales bacterium]MDD4073129.1 helix-turn-helix transcriptional regulator [Desulfobacterales bacterium]MDD4429260.1 helix-turn-helix transcriptional regulator [Paludibacter sp.]